MTLKVPTNISANRRRKFLFKFVSIVILWRAFMNILKMGSLYLLQRFVHDQCVEIGRFLNLLGDNFPHKSSPTMWRLFGLL